MKKSEKLLVHLAAGAVVKDIIIFVLALKACAGVARDTFELILLATAFVVLGAIFDLDL